MKKILLSLLIGSNCFGQVFDKVSLLQSGTNDKRIIIAVLGMASPVRNKILLFLQLSQPLIIFLPKALTKSIKIILMPMR